MKRTEKRKARKKKQFTSPLAINKSIDEVLMFQYLYSCVSVCALSSCVCAWTVYIVQYSNPPRCRHCCLFRVYLFTRTNVIFPKDFVFFAHLFTHSCPFSLHSMALSTYADIWKYWIHSYKFLYKSNLVHLFIISLAVIYELFEHSSVIFVLLPLLHFATDSKSCTFEFVGICFECFCVYNSCVYMRECVQLFGRLKSFV